MIAKGGTIGILGAGQLGKMLAEAATKLGYKTHIYAPDEDPIAASVATHFTKADYTDLPALQKFAASVDVITLEFENVPVGPLRTLTTPVYPSPDILAISQHRVKEKNLAVSLGINTAQFVPISSLEELGNATDCLGKGILKTTTLGYDGKGQWKVPTQEELFHIPPHGKTQIPEEAPYICEQLVIFEKEISVIVARNEAGDVQCFEPVENVHKNHILHTTTAPANISDTVRKRAVEIATLLANELKLIGLLAIELFVTADDNVIFNEMAPRPHNSGHWTMDGASVSQFEQAIRAVTGMLLIAPERKAAKVVMTNLIGDDINDLDEWIAQGAHVHIYGKKEIRPGRKMGHITKVEP